MSKRWYDAPPPVCPYGLRAHDVEVAVSEFDANAFADRCVSMEPLVFEGEAVAQANPDSDCAFCIAVKADAALSEVVVDVEFGFERRSFRSEVVWQRRADS